MYMTSSLFFPNGLLIVCHNSDLTFCLCPPDSRAAHSQLRWDVEGSFFHTLSDILLIKTRNKHVTWKEARTMVKTETHGTKGDETGSTEQRRRTLEVNDDMDCFKTRQTCSERAELVEDELTHRSDSIRSRVVYSYFSINN